MRTKWMTVAVLAALGGTSGAVRGEDVITSPGGGPVVGFADDCGPVATEAGSGYYGLGVLASGAGDYNLKSAEAIRVLEEARTRAIANHKLAVENWYDLKRQNREFRASKLDPLTPAQLGVVTASQRPERLSRSDYNSMSGKLTWPVALRGDSFAAEREVVDEAFAERTSRDMGAGSEFHFKVRRMAERMLAKLRDRIDLFGPNEFIAAKNFLTALRYEAQSPANLTELASR